MTSLRWVVPLLAAAVVGAACARPAVVPASRPGPDTRVAGDPAPVPLEPRGSVVHVRADYGWTLQTLRGEPVELDAYRGRVLFINVWATWCVPCVAELGSIQRLRDSVRGADVEFLLVSPEDAAPVERFLKRYDYDLPVLLEADRMPDVFDLRALPTTYIIDRSGNIVLRHRGAARWDQDAIRDYLRALAG